LATRSAQWPDGPGGTLLPRLRSPYPFPSDKPITSPPTPQTARRMTKASGKNMSRRSGHAALTDVHLTEPVLPDTQSFNDQSVRYGQSKKYSSTASTPHGAPETTPLVRENPRRGAA
jgi:hypothetical protein